METLKVSKTSCTGSYNIETRGTKGLQPKNWKSKHYSSVIRQIPRILQRRSSDFCHSSISGPISGPESVATILRVAVVYIVCTPRVYRRLMAEIDGRLQAGGISSPIAYRETKELPFLCAFIKEIFWIHPPMGSVALHPKIKY